MKKLAVLSTLFLGLTGCTYTDTNIKEFHAGKPLVFNVKHLEVVMKNPATFTGLKGKTKSLQALEEALQVWAVSTFVPAGEEGNIFVTFEEARVREVPVKAKSTDLFSKDATSRFDARVAVRFEALNSHGFVEGSGFARAEHSITLYDQMTYSERERRLEQLCQDVVQDLDEQVRAGVEDAMRQSLKY
jgi:hypothetical protein